jgi:hypothetical protein
MAGHDAFESESDYGFSLPHLMGGAGLVVGMGLFLAISSSSPPDSPVRPISRTKSPKPQAVEAPPAQLLAATRPVETDPIKPAVAERRPFPSLSPQKALKPAIVAAIAEKPRAELSDSPVSKRQRLTELELESSLNEFVPTVGFSSGQAKLALEEVRTSTQRALDLNEVHEEVLALRKKFGSESLPFAEKSECELEGGQARALERHSRMLHSQISAIDRQAQAEQRTRAAHRARTGSPASGSFGSGVYLADRDLAVAYAIRYQDHFQMEEAIPALAQILQAESTPVREKWVELLMGANSPEATRALADRAVFDLSPTVRQYANLALKDRPHKDYRPELLKALRYPWPPVAWHAAEALVAVKDTDAAPFLREMLDVPDPAKPFRHESGQLLVRELVRVNHFQNCLLCHAPSRDNRDLVVGPVPTPGRTIPSAYYGSHRGSRDVLVRADVTYLRQDFSVMHTVEDARAWPERQRFDYLVRTREATPEETIAQDTPAAAEAIFNYPQRDAVLYALRKLTGRNAGTSAADWRSN